MTLDRLDPTSQAPEPAHSANPGDRRLDRRLRGLGFPLILAAMLAPLALWAPASGAEEPADPGTYSTEAEDVPGLSEVDAAARLVTCSEFDGRFRPTRIADRISLGLGVSFEECIDAIQASNEGVVCGRHDRNEFRIVKIGTPETGFFSLGRDVTQEQCLQMTAAAHDGLVCTRERRGFRQTEIETGISLGGDITLEQCLLL